MKKLSGPKPMKNYTMKLPDELVTFFKKRANKTDGHYQAIMREVLLRYAKRAGSRK